MNIIVGEIMINNIINWMVENCEWVFSGIGVTVLVGIIGFIRKRVAKDSDSEKSIKIEQKNKGNNATQIGIQNNYYGGNKDDQ